MRNISWFIAAVAAALIGASTTFAQGPVQVIIGPDGVKVIDPRTGKELPSVVTKVPGAQPMRIQVEVEQPKKAKPPGGFDIEIELAHKELLRAIQLQHGGKADKIEIQQIELKIIPGPDGKPQIVALQPRAGGGQPAAGMSVDKKIDLLLKQVAELRQDVNAIKAKLDGKSVAKSPYQFEYFLPRDDKSPRILILPKVLEEKGLDKETIERIMKFMKEMEKKDKKDAGQGPDKKKPADANADLERRFERILQEAEALRNEIRKLKGPGKE